MSDTESKGRLIGDDEIERLRAIFDPARKLETDEDLLELAELVEDESDESTAGRNGNSNLGLYP